DYVREQFGALRRVGDEQLASGRARGGGEENLPVQLRRGRGTRVLRCHVNVHQQWQRCGAEQPTLLQRFDELLNLVARGLAMRLSMAHEKRQGTPSAP